MSQETANIHRTPFVNGTWLAATGESNERRNPADEAEIVGTWTPAGTDDLNTAVASAKAFAKAWGRRPIVERGRILQRAADLLVERADEIGLLMSREEGKTFTEGRGEVVSSAEMLRFYAAQAWQPQGEVYPGTDPDDLVRTHRVPVGVVGVITPWNFPLSIPVWKIAPALVFGCPVVWKPASNTVLTGAVLVDALIDAGLPRQVIQFVPGPGSRGQELAEHADVRAVTFTGSEPIGRLLQQIAAKRNVPLQAELGGHNPAIVFPDADLDLAVDALVVSVTSGSGQKCTAARRIFLHESIRDQVVAALVERFEALRVGPGIDPMSQLGPVIDAKSRDDIVASLRKAIDDGATLLTGGADIPEMFAGGSYIMPTLFETDDMSIEIACEEVFGPVSTVITFREEDEVFAQANSTRFGLSAAIFTSDERRARRAADQLEAGLLNINKSTTGTEMPMPFGGMKASSAPGPKERGGNVRDFFTEVKAVYSTATMAAGEDR